MNQKPTRTLGVFSWSLIENLSGTGINFLVSLILARLLGPDVYGIIAVALIFVALSNVLIDGGFSNSLIRRKVVSSEDYNTVFVINVSIAVFIYGLFFLLAPFIASFYSNAQLTEVIRYICITVIIGSFSIVPKVWLTRNLDFKRQAIASILSSTLGAGVGIMLVFANWGIWALVAQQLVRQSVYTIILLLIVPQRPRFSYSSASATNLFGYGSRPPRRRRARRRLLTRVLCRLADTAKRNPRLFRSGFDFADIQTRLNRIFSHLSSRPLSTTPHAPSRAQTQTTSSAAAS